MSGLARKIVVCAAVDGLILQPLNSRKEHQRPTPPIKIKYGDAVISSVSRDPSPDISNPNASFEAFGIVGLLTVSRCSYLISITRRQQVAQIRGSPVYVVTEVALTPCTSFREATTSVAQTAVALQSQGTSELGDDESSTEDDFPATARRLADSDDVGDEDEPDSAVEPTPTNRTAGVRRSSIARDVIGRRGSYGRFAQRWFSRTGWAMDQKRQMGLTDAAPTEAPSTDAAATTGVGTGGEVSTSDGTDNSRFGSAIDEEESRPPAGGLLPKLLRTTQILFGSSRSFFFSYDYDITRRLANRDVAGVPDLALHEQVDPMYFWNRHMIQPFMDAGADAFSLPLMQGFVGQRTFIMDSDPPQIDDEAKDSVELSNFVPSGPVSPPSERVSAELRPTQRYFDITLISRRSVKRAGLRYHRRGVNDEGYVANAVETEQVLSPSVWDDPTAKVFSFVQTRGSIPLFFTQSPYSLRPVPELRHSAEANFKALKKHFDLLEKQYGSLQVVNLVEKHGIEAPIGTAFESNVQRLNDEARPKTEHGGDGSTEEKSVEDKVPFEWFDFHSACRGMKFENVALLLEALGKKLENFGSTVVVDGKVTTRQKGVLRTNCMDCLDRTNVCQSSFAKHMLDMQLKEQGFDMSAQLDLQTVWFNTLWADNGDAISKQYASTSAMKGDYTRTRKRNYRGALMDAGLSLTRFFNGMVNDFFLQATIDFLLGNVTGLVFEEFEANMMTQDPAVSTQKMREQAIELCQKRVVADESEEFIGGWTMLTPSVPDTVKAQTFEEAVLLLTDAALYLCRFDWNLDKVSSFERVELAHVQGIRFGTYITSTISPAQVDELRNVGLVISYKPGSNDITRINTRSLSSVSGVLKARVDAESAKIDGGSSSGFASLLNRWPPAPTPPRKIALKALYAATSIADSSSKGGRRLSSAADGGGGGGEAVSARLTEIQLVVSIAAEIERLAILSQPRLAGGKPEDRGFVEKGDIISLAEAKRSTGLLEQLGHSIKKLVWA